MGDKMIRILHSVSNMDRAGIETMLMNYYRHIDRNKVQFDFLCNKKKPGAYDEEIKKLGGRIFHTPGLNPARYSQYLAYMNNLFSDYPEYRIVEAHNGALGVYALYAAKVNSIPQRIFHAHGASITKDWKFPLKLICKTFLPATMNQRFSCGEAAARCYFGETVTKNHNYVMIPNAIEVERFVFHSELRNKIRYQYGLENKHVIGHVGRFMKQKNHTFLIDVFADVVKRDSDAVLVLLGDGELQQKIKLKVKEKELEEKVFFVGNVENVNEWYNAFDVFVLPSIWEGLPVVGIEAQANDLPCIFSDSITNEICITTKTELVSLSTSPSEWANMIITKFNNSERCDNTDIISNHHYDIASESKNLQELYLRLYEECK